MSYILETQGLLKVYPDGTVANRDISVKVEERTIHAVVGENGAGKSTLMKMIFGVEEPQEGEIIWRGKPVEIKNPNQAIALGIGMVHQHLMLAGDLTVAENMVLGVEPKKNGIFFDSEKMITLTRQISKENGLEVPADKLIRELPIGVKQRVEILKALFRNAELLILDEPTAVLTPQETEQLFKTLFTLKERGKTILFISHKLNEVKQIADEVTVMRDSRVVTTRDAKLLSEHDIAYLMVGREIKQKRLPPSPSTGEVRLSVEGLSYRDEEGVALLKDVTFEVRAGEILGVAGVEGNGQTPLIRALTGLLSKFEGEIRVNDQSVAGLTPRQIRERGVAHIPEDRMEDGVAATTNLEENFIVDRYYKPGYSKMGRLLWKEIRQRSKQLVGEFNILARSTKTAIGSLSGGNIQKVVVARELSSNPEVIVAAQPTRGIDIGSAEMVHNLLKDARDEGKAIFLVSADLEEVLKLSTRIVVLYRGEIVAHLENSAEVTARELGPYMLGVKKEAGSRGTVRS